MVSQVCGVHRAPRPECLRFECRALQFLAQSSRSSDQQSRKLAEIQGPRPACALGRSRDVPPPQEALWPSHPHPCVPSGRTPEPRSKAMDPRSIAALCARRETIFAALRSCAQQGSNGRINYDPISETSGTMAPTPGSFKKAHA